MKIPCWFLEEPKRIGSSFTDDTNYKAIQTMRRMMHSFILIVCFGAPAFAQQTSSSLPLPTTEPAPSENLVGAAVNPPSGRGISVDYIAPSVVGGYSDGSFMQQPFDRPYSPLAAKMSCSDASPNLWCGYASERAAIAAKVMQHVDMQCGCQQGSGCATLHSAPCASGCDGAGCKTEGLGCREKATKAPKVNRYREPFSSLHGAPCVECSTGKCKLGHRQHGRGNSSDCNSCSPNPAPVQSLYQQPSGCASIPIPAYGSVANNSLLSPMQNNLSR